MSWVPDFPLSFFEKCCIGVLKCGSIPHHVAFIMDGNRRYAKKNNIQRSEGHRRGYDKIREVLTWSLTLGIPEVTIYGLSTENLKRSKEEVNDLIEIIAERLQIIMKEKEKYQHYGVRVRVIGNFSPLSPELKKLIAEVCLATKNNKKIIFNFALAYTSRDEIVSATQSIVRGVEKGSISIDDIDEDLVSACMFTDSKLGLIVRTSGEVRFSDFLLWQISKFNSLVCFLRVFWPSFGIWDFLTCVFKYQINLHNLKNDEHVKVKSEKLKKYIEEVEHWRLKQLQNYL